MDGQPMDSVMADPIVEDYLRRLDYAARVLPDDRRRELVDEIAGHIAESRAGGQVRTEADLRTLLDRLGDPAEIVAAAREGDDPLGSPAGPAGLVRVLRRPSIATEITAVLLLTAGSLFPFVGWIAGVVVLWTSRRWRTWEKVLATLVFPGGPGLAAVAGAVGIGSTSCSSTGSSTGDEVTHCTGSGISVALGLPLFVVWIVAPIVIGIVLLARARDRAAAEPPIETWVPVAAAPRWGGLEIAAVALLIAGAFVLPVVGPGVGLACAWVSDAWTTQEKWIATALAAVPALFGVLFLLAAFALATWLFLFLLPIALLAAVGAGLFLAVRLNARRQTPSPEYINR